MINAILPLSAILHNVQTQVTYGANHHKITMPNSLKLACIQTQSTADMAENIASAGAQVAYAAGRGAEFIVLPENVFYMRAEGEEAPPRYAEGEHPGIAAARGWAESHGVWLLVGSAAVAADEARVFNRSLLIDPQGGIAARYDKIHLFDVEVGDGQVYRESKRVAPGDRAVAANTPWGVLGMSICYDLRFPHLYRALAKAGASMLAVPAAFTQVTGEAHWHALLRARAIENGCFVFAPAQAGLHPGGRRTYGHSLIIGPWGEVIAEGGGEGAEVVMAEIDLREVARVRKMLPSLGHDREFSVSPPSGNSRLNPSAQAPT